MTTDQSREARARRRSKPKRYVGHSVNSWCGRHGFVRGGGPCRECISERGQKEPSK